MTELHVRPNEVEQGSRETLPWRFDTAALLAPGEVPTIPTATLTNLRSGALHPEGLVGTPTISGIYITQPVTALTAGATYRLSVGFTAAADKIWEMHLTVHCPA